MNKRFKYILIVMLLLINMSAVQIASAATPKQSVIATPDSGLSLEVSPSPLVLSVKPGEQKTIELSIYNNGTAAENLKMRLQSFTVNSKNGRINLLQTAPQEVSGWISFSKPLFNLAPGQRTAQIINISVPETAGFSYSFAMVISRNQPSNAQTSAKYVGSVAVFTLINIDRPDATKKLTITGMRTNQGFYEYLPAEIFIKLHNSGNSLILPAGNVFMARHSTDKEPLSVLEVNKQSLYLLPGVTREFSTKWDDGLPAYKTKDTAANVAPSQHLEWNWRNSHFRIGKYIAHAVVIYNDGHRDVPVESEVSFWVIPYKIILGVLLLAALLIYAMYMLGKNSFQGAKRARHKVRKFRSR